MDIPFDWPQSYLLFSWAKTDMILKPLSHCERKLDILFSGNCGQRVGVERETCPLCRREESATHVLLNIQETKRWREKYMNDAVTFKQVVRCSKTTDLSQLSTFLYQVGSTWGHHTKQSELLGLVSSL
jgi:hypothetical protein